MFKLIGGVVVCGFALYGLSKYLKRPVMNLVIQSADLANTGEARRAEAGAHAPADSGGEQAYSPEVDSTLAVA